MNNAFADNIQEKLFRLEVTYAKRLKIQQICFEKKLSGLQKNIKELTSEMEVSERRNINLKQRIKIIIFL